MNECETFYNEPFSNLIELACSRSHVPGGGSISAMSAILGASMTAMVANLTLNKKGYEDTYIEVQMILDRVTGSIEELKKLTQRDMDSFDSLISAYRLPKETEGQKELRRREIQKSAIEAAMAPLTISHNAYELLFLNKRLSEIGNGSVVNDCAVATIVLEGAVRAAMLSVDVNFDTILDPEVKATIKARRDKILGEATVIRDETLLIVDQRDKAL
ncbi:MAG: cyclodeaminase/cyclohydrolase family protein [Deltaproteobacteria bacterium]|jgi:formiminotetrahydrofolate cyclodeaminase|nr:cyclodeaminase/cyclohydrolase family protein [Deltaproteobacteria bacterium]